MLKTRALIALVAAGLVAAGAGASAAPSFLAASLRVTVDGVNGPGGGTLRVGVYDEATFPENGDIALFRRDMSAIAGDVSLQFDRLPPGTYAVRAYQDLNNNGRWEMGEPRGISNAAAPENFDAAALVLQPGVNMAVIHLR